MQHFFGFIDYSNNHPPTLIEKKSYNINYLYYYKNYTLFLSYKKDKTSISLDDEEVLLLFNGKISNRTFLLYKLNISDQSITTLALIKEAYRVWKTELMNYLEGDFSLIIFDKKKEYLILNKNKMGILPLSYFNSSGLIIFGSHLNDFKKCPNFTPQINPRAVANYLQFGSLIQPNTILKDCYKVKSGTSIAFDLVEKTQKEILHWSLESEYYNKKLLINTSNLETDSIHHSEDLLISAINKAEISEKKVSLSLSGGYDSSTIAALIHHKSDYTLETFTIGFENEKINEAPYAKAIAKHLGNKHHEHYFSAKDVIETIPKLSQVYDEPFSDHAAAPTLLTTQMIKAEGITNLFIGDGGDEVFATADDVHFFDWIISLPYELRAGLIAPLKKLNMDAIPYIKEFHNFPTKYEKLLSILSAKEIPQMTKSKNILFREKELQQLIKGYYQPLRTTFDEINFNGYNETVDEIIGVYFKTTMIDKELVKSYSAANYHNLSIHTPFLDDQLISYMAKIPSSLKIKKGIKKYILKEIAHSYLPKSLLNRPKSGFTVYYDSWMRNELKELVYAQVNEERLKQDNIFNSYDIIKIRDHFYKGNNNYKTKLWRIFLFQLWYENFKG